jgi:hypothetical protein
MISSRYIIDDPNGTSSSSTNLGTESTKDSERITNIPIFPDPFDPVKESADNFISTQEKYIVEFMTKMVKEVAKKSEIEIKK